MDKIKAFLNSITKSIKDWNYYVDWEKVNKNKSFYEIYLNHLNFLIGKKDFDAEFIKLFNYDKNIVKILPILIATRDSSIEIFRNVEKNNQIFEFEKITDDPKLYLNFINNSGIKNIFLNYNIKNLVDYVFGIEVGLDSNARKNRSGNLMENLIESYLLDLKNKGYIDYTNQANSKKIKEKFNININENRIFDFVILNKKNQLFYFIEVNYFNGQGTKIKAVCDEFINLNFRLQKLNYKFVWITDGEGWHSSKSSLKRVFKQNLDILNIKQLNDGLLIDIFNKYTDLKK
jgi:hypothetical protein